MTPTERFVDLLSELLPEMTDEQRVRLEDAFKDAVQRVAEGAVQYATDPRFGE